VAKRLGVKVAYLKSKSPSCGVGRCRIDGPLAHGDGVCAARLRQAGVKVVSV
jgi:uncharacterized protein YbbK (DUF523 family)